MTKGRATVLVEPNRIETWEVEIADPEAGGALVEVVIGGVCGSDVHIMTGEAGIMPFQSSSATKASVGWRSSGPA